MKSITAIEIGLVIFLAAMILLPFAIVSAVHTHAPYTEAPPQPVRDILDRQGVVITNVQETWWNIPGALGGEVYTIRDMDGQKTNIMTQEFVDQASRDAAIRSWHAGKTGRGRTNGDLLVSGRQVVVITPANRPVLGIIGPDLAMKQE